MPEIAQRLRPTVKVGRHNRVALRTVEKFEHDGAVPGCARGHIFLNRALLLHSGFWKMAHEAHTDYAMLLGCLFLLIVGASRWSIEHQLYQWQQPEYQLPCPRTVW